MHTETDFRFLPEIRLYKAAMQRRHTQHQALVKNRPQHAQVTDMDVNQANLPIYLAIETFQL